MHELRLTTARLDRGHHFCTTCLAPAADEDVRSFARERFRRRATDAGRTSGDQRSLSIQFLHSILQYVSSLIASGKPLRRRMLLPCSIIVSTGTWVCRLRSSSRGHSALPCLSSVFVALRHNRGPQPCVTIPLSAWSASLAAENPEYGAVWSSASRSSFTVHPRCRAPRRCVLSFSLCPVAASTDTTTRLRYFRSRPGQFHTPPQTCSMAVSKNGARNGSPCVRGPFASPNTR